MPIISIHFTKWSCSLLQARSEQMGGMTPTPAITVTWGHCSTSCLCPLLSFQQSFRWSHRRVSPVPFPRKGKCEHRWNWSKGWKFLLVFARSHLLGLEEKNHKKHLTLLFSIRLFPHVCLFALIPNIFGRASKAFPGMKQPVLHPKQDRIFYFNDKIFLLPPVFF